MQTKRLRIFAGPNGAGKSTLIKIVSDLGIHLGTYVNADDLKAFINRNHFFDFESLGLLLDMEDMQRQLKGSSLFILSEGSLLINSPLKRSCLILRNWILLKRQRNMVSVFIYILWL